MDDRKYGEKSREKIDLWAFGWRERKDGKLVKPRCFLPWPTKILSLQFIEKIEERGIVASITKLSSLHIFFFFFFAFLGMRLARRSFSTFFFLSFLGVDMLVALFFSFFLEHDTSFALLIYLFIFFGFS